ncbi:DUF4168 domain-containing protein [Paenalcaligenes niemegkensis]|uniref:DUF4168 domain-containing protein n=1 Tax=Paenalcaligenes niemegkensis TaxID=2895469 RepID=UPI001EE8D718|nr:DUF4168 domain-containing protein [Paenalcaligenes niemegkensis]MCQ9616709.1 DUF4168 domain-containing protein [Paenalcaligenes niemegkensis]
MNSSVKAFLATAVISLGLSAPIAMAQTAPAAPAPAPQAIQPDSAQLNNYAKAAKRVSTVVAEYQPKLEGAQDDATRQQILTEADSKMVSEVESSGMSVQEYNGISVAVQQDPQLRKQVEDMVGSM